MLLQTDFREILSRRHRFVRGLRAACNSFIFPLQVEKSGYPVLTFALALVLAASGVARGAEFTLSGRVTDPSSQPVEGAFVFVQQMPGFVFINGATTQSDGSYGFSLPAGTYRLTVDPKRGPLIPQVIESFSIFANTTRDFPLASGFTLSGRVTDSTGTPVSQAYVSVSDADFREVSFANIDDAGQYSLGAPAGTYLIQVFPGGRFIRQEIGGFVLDRDRVLDIILQTGVLIAGRVVDENGQGVAGANIAADDIHVGVGVDFFAGTSNDGSFQFSVPPAIYVISADPLPPLTLTRTQVDARSGDITDLVLRVSRVPAPFVPDKPPIASLIQISAPDSAGDVTVTGAPGTVASNGVVALITLNTGDWTVVQAKENGSFDASLFAPAGTCILVKVDPLGIVIGKYLQGLPDLIADGVGFLSQLPGTILRVSDPPGAGPGVPFGGAGITQLNTPSPLPAWTFHGTLDTQQVPAGGTIRVEGTLKVISPVLETAGAMTANVQLTLERVSGPEGHGSLAENTYASVFLTPTGLPIEREARHTNEGLDSFAFVDLISVAPNQAEASVDVSLPIPNDLPAGFYRPTIVFNFGGVPPEVAPTRPVISSVLMDRARRNFNRMHLPVVRVGNPAAPRLYWTLLTDTLSNGTRGTRAVEDRERFGVASRIVTQSETFIVPRVDVASGQPLTYRLEPFAPTVSLGDQAPPNPPFIPFRFPSGSLTVTVKKPDGSVDVLGPAPFVQARMKSLTDPETGLLLDGGGGHITDAYQLSTMDPRFEVQFTHDGLHVITLNGSIEDVWGNVWHGGGTYEVYVARTLSLDTAVLPGTPFEVGDVFNPGLVLTPPVPADVEVRFRLAPNSDANQMIERMVQGRANRFGHFQPPDSGISLDQRGEYRVDVTATFRDDQGTLWMGARTWGGVVAPHNPPIIAHGRRGIDGEETIGSQWFFRTDTGIPLGPNHTPFAFNSGDVMWQQESDTPVPMVTFQDPSGSIVSLQRTRGFDSMGQFLQVPLGRGPGNFDERAAVGETMLFSSRPDWMDPHLDPSKVDLWGYSYRAVERPLVRVREEIGEDEIPPPYWGFGELYGNQIGMGSSGDLVNDIKFQYGAAVLRGPALSEPLYAIYGSLFVLVPDDDPLGGTRTFPPFQGNGGGPSGGPIMTLKGRDIDLFINLRGVRPGSVLEVGNTFALSGAIGPTLPAFVNYTVTKPNGQQLSFSGRANKVGYYYRPENDFIVDQPGIYTVDLKVTYDGLTSAGQVTQPYPTGDVLGTADGRFVVYVVSPGSPLISAQLPGEDFLTPPAIFDVTMAPPAGMNLSAGHVTTMMPGFILETGDLSPSAGKLAYSYDSVALSADFPNLDVSRFGTPQASDVITVSVFASGTNSDGSPAFAAGMITLHGQELFAVVGEPAALPPPSPLSMVSALPEAEQGVAYNASLVSGGTPPYLLNFIKGALPQGLQFNSDGTVSGVPNATRGRPFTAKVSDQHDSSVTEKVAITVFKALSIRTKRLKTGKLGRNYSLALKATGGKAPYTWSLIGTTLPGGLSLDSASGMITGTPTETGAFPFTIQVNDELGAILEMNFTLVIK